MKQKRLSLKKWMILFLAFTLLSNLRAEHFPWPDFEHWRYGLPLLWLTHQTSSIAGPVDRWFFDYPNLAVNMVFWALIALLVARFLTWEKPRTKAFSRVKV